MNISAIRPSSVTTPLAAPTTAGAPQAPLAAIRDEVSNAFGFVGTLSCPWGHEPKDPKPGKGA